MRMLFVVKSVCFIGTVQSVLTSSSNTIKLEPGYYDAVTISTNITSLASTITYTHHQCSNTESDLTYTDANINASGAASVSETTVNGKTVSTTQGGCYTTPYYYYGCNHSEGYTVTDITTDFGKLRNHRYRSTCNECGAHRDYGAIGHDWESITEADKQSEYARQAALRGEGISHISGYTYDSTHSNILKTYYIKTCGYANGELISATITY